MWQLLKWLRSTDAVPAPYQPPPAAADGVSLIDSPQEVLQILGRLHDEGQGIRLHFPGSPVAWASRVVHVDPRRRVVLFRRPWLDQRPRLLVAAGVFTLIARYKNTPLLGTTRILDDAEREGIACLAAPVLGWLTSLEMRAFLRVRPIPADAAKVTFSHLDKPVSGTLVDISESGIRVAFGRGGLGELRDGGRIRGAALILPHVRLSGLELRVRGWRDVGRQTLLGVEFENLPEPDRKALRRYIQPRSVAGSGSPLRRRA